MSSSAWKVALALRLGIALFPGSTRCPVCSRRSADIAPVLDPSGQHALTCKYEDGMTRRHHILRNVLARYCKEVGIVALVEHPLLHQVPDSSGHSESPVLRMDIYIPAAYGLHSTDIAVDVTVAHPSARRHISPSTVTAGAAATLAEREKHRHYGTYCNRNDILLSPVGIDIYGALGDDGKAFFRRLASFAASRRGSSPQQELRDFVTRFAFSLQIMQARQVSTRRPHP